MLQGHVSMHVGEGHEPEIVGRYDDTRTLPTSDRAPGVPPEQLELPTVGAKRPRRPIESRWNFLPCILLIIFVLAATYYLYIRFTTLTSHYAIFIVACEILGLSSFIPYAILLTRGVFPTGSPGLPPSEEQVAPDANVRFSIHVLIPCYKEPLEVISATVLAALETKLPANTRRTVYLLDDGGSVEKRAFIQSFGSPLVQYITGRERKPGQVNGKSENLNNALRAHIFDSCTKSGSGETDWAKVPANELIVVFDADMRAKPDFFLKTLEVMADDNIQLVLTPQAFHNIHPDSDLFNNINKQFWEYWLPGAFAYGYIACTGTNFVIRARALASCGWFPNQTITEDYALGMELKKRGYQATYLMQYLAEGEAPEDVRNIFQQRSRWTKGHYQVFFSRANPLLIAGLPLFQRLWYCYAAWAPFCNTITTPVFILVPFISIMFGYHPVSISFEYVLAATAYFASTLAIQYYVHTFAHLKSMWFVNISNTVLFFTQWKALMNSLMASVGAKDLTFKVTTKNKAAQEGEGLLHPKLLLQQKQHQHHTVNGSDDSWASLPTRGRTLSVIKTRGEGKGHHLLADADDTTPCYTAHDKDGQTPLASKYPHQHLSRRSSPRHPPTSMCVTPMIGTPRATPRSDPKAGLSILPTPRAMEAPREKRQRRIRAVLESFRPRNIRDIGAMADPLVMVLIFLLSVATGCVGIWQLSGSSPGASRFTFSEINGSPFLIIATMWAFYNSVSPLLFMHYCWTTGSSFRFSVRWLSFLSTCIALGMTIFMWMLIPISVDPSDALGLALTKLYPNAVALDTNTNFTFIAGLNELPVQVSQAVNLTGGLLTSDHVKYGMPLAYSLTMLSWAVLKFPAAFVGRDAPLLATLREGADYLMRCDLNPGSTDNPMFVAQIGDAAPYVLVQDAGFDPILSGKVWTSPWEDPALVGNSSRKVWLMTKDHVGADLLADAAAALAAVGKVFNTRDPTFSARAIRKAAQLYRFATRQDVKPQSYCEFVPCTTNVSIKENVIVRKVDVNATNGTISDTCYYLDWITRTCRIGASLAACVAETKVSNNVYANRLDCCNVLYQLDPTNTKAQGICAVPEDQWYCYVSLDTQRTCIKQTIDPTTGEGCTGKALTVYTSSLSCCEGLGTSGIIDPSSGKAGTGICSSTGLIGNATSKCWVPSLSEGTCVESSGSGCSSYGLETSYDSVIGCCNRLVSLINDNIKLLGAQTTVLTGVCARKPSPPVSPPRPSSPSPPPAVAANLTARRALADSTTSTSTTSNTTLNGTVWKLPEYLSADTACTDGSCILQQINKTKSVGIYNSTSVLDDLAWGAAWLYWATGDPTYLGMAERYLGRHYREDLKETTLARDRTYYVSDWNNVAWASNVLLANLSGGAAEYVDRVNPFLKAWVTGDPVDQSVKNSTLHDVVLPTTVLENYTDASGTTYFIIPGCKATATWETDCTDGLDNDCNGLIDKEDPACGLFPVLYTSQNLPLSFAPSLPNAANTAFLAMVYADVYTPAAKVLHCWGLGQATYMLGGTQTVDSSIVGYGPRPPTIVQHRASSCPRANSTSVPCTWNSGFYPNIPNPNLEVVQGALIWGPADGSDQASKLRQSDDTRVRLEDNVGMTGLLAGLADRELNVESCFLGHGVWQKYIWPTNPL